MTHPDDAPLPTRGEDAGDDQYHECPVMTVKGSIKFPSRVDTKWTALLEPAADGEFRSKLATHFTETLTSS